MTNSSAQKATRHNIRQSMASLHSWAGLLAGWLLFVIFLFGTAAFFQQEINRWMRPELHGTEATEAALEAASRTLASNIVHADSWRISLPSPRGGEPLTLSWQPREDEASEPRIVQFDPETGRLLTVRDTRGAEFFYRMHFDLHYIPYWLARYLVSIAALAMLVAILSGVITHKKIFADFFLLRFGRGQRSWLDAHNVTAILALPFHLMITYTGLVTLLFTLMPWAISANFPSQSAFFETAYSGAPKIEPRGKVMPLLPLHQLIGKAERTWGDAKPSLITISHAGDANSIVGLSAAPDRLGGYRPRLWLNGVTGALVQPVSSVGGASATQRVMVDLHSGRFSGPVLRWLYFLSGVGGTVMVASGLVLWTVKRRAKLPDPAHPHFGFRLVERLNIGVIAGAPAGIAVYFLANRLLPLDMTNRADWEINSLFIAWGAVFVWAIARPARRAWIEALAICAMFYALVPVVSALTTTRGLATSLIARDWVFVGFDGVMLATAAAFALAAWKVAAHKPTAVPRRKARGPVEVAA